MSIPEKSSSSEPAVNTGAAQSAEPTSRPRAQVAEQVSRPRAQVRRSGRGSRKAWAASLGVLALAAGLVFREPIGNAVTSFTGRSELSTGSLAGDGKELSVEEYDRLAQQNIDQLARVSPEKWAQQIGIIAQTADPHAREYDILQQAIEKKQIEFTNGMAASVTFFYEGEGDSAKTVGFRLKMGVENPYPEAAVLSAAAILSVLQADINAIYDDPALLVLEKTRRYEIGDRILNMQTHDQLRKIFSGTTAPNAAAREAVVLRSKLLAELFAERPVYSSVGLFNSRLPVANIQLFEDGKPNFADVIKYLGEVKSDQIPLTFFSVNWEQKKQGSISPKESNLGRNSYGVNDVFTARNRRYIPDRFHPVPRKD